MSAINRLFEKEFDGAPALARSTKGAGNLVEEEGELI